MSRIAKVIDIKVIDIAAWSDSPGPQHVPAALARPPETDAGATSHPLRPARIARARLWGAAIRCRKTNVVQAPREPTRETCVSAVAGGYPFRRPLDGNASIVRLRAAPSRMAGSRRVQV